MTTGITTCNLYRRKSAPSVNTDKADYFVSGDELKINNVVTGDSYEGINTWYELDGGIYAWSGGVSLNPTDPIFLKKLDLDKKTETPGVLKPFNPNDYWWLKNYGIDKIWERGITGRGVKVAVLDEGLDIPHPDLPNLIEDHFVDITDNGQERLDRNSHGTHVFGILAASNNGFGITGLCFNSEFFFVKVHHFNLGYKHEYLISAINWAIEKKVDIISISQGFELIKDKDFDPLNICIEKAIAAKIAIFCAAGNQGGVLIRDVPAKFSTDKAIFSVGHVDEKNNPINTTVLDSNVSIFAPGFKITSTGRATSDLYFEDSGSSMATPYVSGIASLILEEKRKTDSRFTALDAADLLLSNADTTGFGKIVNPKKIFDL